MSSGLAFGSLDVLLLEFERGLVPESGCEIVSARAGLLVGNALDLALFARGTRVDEQIPWVLVSRADDIGLTVPGVEIGDVG